MNIFHMKHYKSNNKIDLHILIYNIEGFHPIEHDCVMIIYYLIYILQDGYCLFKIYNL